MFNYLIWILVITLYAPVFYTLYRFRWDKVDYTHAYFILPISLWLTWRKRAYLKELIQKTKSGNNLFSFSLLLLLFGILMFMFGWREDYQLIYTLSIVPLLYGLISYLYGMNVAKALSFPILYLLLLVPPPFGILDSITLPMRHGVSVVTEAILSLFNYPIKREGLLLSIGYHDIFMGQPCSGFRSLITMFSLVLVYIYISKAKLAKKLILTSFIMPLALLGNLIRIITLCLITFYFGEEAGQGFFHNFSGIVIFVIVILGIMGVESLLEKNYHRKT
mgnify:CR=1 FL=1